jgi:hypothetical protein
MTNNALRSAYLTALLVVGLLSGCSNTVSCGDSHPYLANRQGPPLQAPAGVSVPAPDPAYVIPPTAGGAGQGAVGACMIKPPDVLGPLGAPSATSTYAPTITRHRHGKTVIESNNPTPAPGAATRAPAAAPAASTRAASPVAGGGPLE